VLTSTGDVQFVRWTNAEIAASFERHREILGAIPSRRLALIQLDASDPCTAALRTVLREMRALAAQPPLRAMAAHDRPEEEAEVWAAQAETDIAVLIQRYLAENPPPGPSRIHEDFRLWATNLQRDGQDRLAALGRRPLRGMP